MVLVERRVTLDASEVASVIGHVERLLPLVTSCRVPQTMSDPPISTKRWVIQLALKHGIGILCCSLARYLAVLDFHIIVLDLFLVAIF